MCFCDVVGYYKGFLVKGYVCGLIYIIRKIWDCVYVLYGKFNFLVKIIFLGFVMKVIKLIIKMKKLNGKVREIKFYVNSGIWYL